MDEDTKNNAGLHLWSLSVEEQFYLLWPILLLKLKKLNSKYKYSLISGLAIFTVISFMFDLLTYENDIAFNYYFPLCRFWEMALGGILNFINFNLKNKYLKNAFGLIGISMIFYSAFYIN